MQFLKALSAMCVTRFGILTLVNPVHPSNAPQPMLSPHQTIRPLPMLVTLFGIVRFVNPLQRLNAPVPMLVTVSGIVILVNSLHSSNARLSLKADLKKQFATVACACL